MNRCDIASPELISSLIKFMIANSLGSLKFTRSSSRARGRYPPDPRMPAVVYGPERCWIPRQRLRPPKAIMPSRRQCYRP